MQINSSSILYHRMIIVNSPNPTKTDMFAIFEPLRDESIN